ncbi:MAG: RNA 2',3'-cyclic phosphodiesterase [Candidatus Hodarchaeota archaeon]
MNDEKKIRAFISFDLDNEEFVKNAEKMQAAFRKIDAKIKFVETENLHLNLKFLGDIPVRTAKKIYEILTKIDTVPTNGIEIKIKNMGHFGKRVLWCGIQDPSGVVKKTQKVIEDELFEKLKIPKENRAFKAHITLGRIKFLRDKEAFLELVGKYKFQEFGSQKIDKIHLKKSDLTPKGPIYSDLSFD